MPLNQLFRQPGFHDAGKGTGVGKAAALEFLVEIGMSIEVNDG
jgi:hypothetical protein